METLKNQFPEYLPNQVLTEDALNATAKFLEQQDRLTRFGLTKTGIIEGIEFSQSVGKLYIQDGFGVSIDGYFMAHNYKHGNVPYEFVKPYYFDLDMDTHLKMVTDLFNHPFSSEEKVLDQKLAKVQFFELQTAAAKSVDAQPFSTLQYQFYKVVLYMEIRNVQQDQCSVTSCDTAGADQIYRVVPLLVMDNDDALIKPINSEYKTRKRLKLKRLCNLFEMARYLPEGEKIFTMMETEFARVNKQNTRMLLEKLQDIVSLWKFPDSLGDNFRLNNINQLEYAITQLAAMQNKYIRNVDQRNVPFNYGYIAQYDPQSTIPKATRNFLNHTQNLTVHKFRNELAKQHANAKIHYQAYYEFCFDLEQAINEFILYYNEYIHRYYTVYTNRLKRFLVLGDSRMQFYDVFRYYPIENYANEPFREAKKLFFRYFNRIVVLINKFNQGFEKLKDHTEVKLIPSRAGNCALEDKAIPYYYMQDPELDAAWVVTPYKGIKTDIYQYRDHKAPYSHFAYNISSYDYTRIEGLIGNASSVSQKSSMFPALEKQINFFNIPIHFEFVDIDEVDYTIFEGLEPALGVAFGKVATVFYKVSRRGKRQEKVVIACFEKK